MAKKVKRVTSGMPADLLFKFGEIEVNANEVVDGIHLAELYRGKLLVTDLPSAVIAFDRLKEKYK